MPGYKIYLQGGQVHEGLKCSYCLLVLKDPIQTSETGQRYCKECFEDARLVGIPRKVLSFVVSSDFYTD